MNNISMGKKTILNFENSYNEMRFAVNRQLKELISWSTKADVAYYLLRHDKILAKSEFLDLKKDLLNLLELIENFKYEISLLQQSFDERRVKKLIDVRKEIYSRFRATLSLYASLVTNLNWQSPAIKSSIGSRKGIEKTKVVADWNDYKRDRSEDTFHYERYLEKSIFLKSAHGNDTVFNICNSGMGSFTTILYYLLSEHKISSNVLVSELNYVENKLILKSFFENRIDFFETNSTEEICSLVKEKRPSAVFLEQISNTKVLRLFDVHEIVKKISESYKDEIYIIIDVTCSIGFEDFFTHINLPPNIKILLHGSLLKAPQLGLERVNMGFVQAINLQAEGHKILDNRTLSGTNVQDFAANLLPFTTRSLLQKRMKIISENAKILATYIEGFDPESLVIERVIYPGLKSHPDNLIAKKIGFHGFFFNIQLTDKLNQDKYFEIFTKEVIKYASAKNIDIIHGASFGFNHTSIYYSVGWDEPDNHYIRISTGIETAYELEKMKEIFRDAFIAFKNKVMAPSHLL